MVSNMVYYSREIHAGNFDHYSGIIFFVMKVVSYTVQDRDTWFGVLYLNSSVIHS